MSNRCSRPYWLAILCALFLMTVPCFAFAQESDEADDSTVTADTEDTLDEVSQEDLAEEPQTFTKKDNFGGWKFDGEILLGANWYVTDDDDIEDLRYTAHDNSEHAIINGTLQLQLSYLWGNNVFFGPVLNVITGFPMFIAVDLRLRLLIPLTCKDAVSASAGWGSSFFKQIGGREYVLVVPQKSYPLTSVEHEIYRLMYFPIEFTYEHVFDNRFVLGGSMQFIIANRTREYYAREKLNNPPENGPKYNLLHADGVYYDPFISSLTFGVHLGYKF